MSGRRRRIVLLLSSLNDGLPSPGGSLRTSSGLAPVVREPCPMCADTGDPGWLSDRFKRRVPCVTCGGLSPDLAVTGSFRPRDGGRGWVWADPMDSDGRAVQTVVEAAPPTRPPRMVRCDACDGEGTGYPHLGEDGREFRDRCGYCGGSGKRVKPEILTPASEARDEGTRLEDALLRRERGGSYRELERALAGLPRWFRRLVVAVYVDGALSVDELGQDDRDVLGWAMELLDEAMPDRIRVPGDVSFAARAREEHLRTVRGRSVAPEALAERDREIRRLVRRDRPRAWVADQFGLSVSQVGRIVARERADARLSLVSSPVVQAPRVIHADDLDEALYESDEVA